MKAARESWDKLFHGLLEAVRLGLQVCQPAILPHMGILSHMGSMIRISTLKQKTRKSDLISKFTSFRIPHSSKR